MSNHLIYGTDSVALLAYFVNKLGNKGNEIFNQVEENKAKLLIPSIVIGEILYTILKEKNIFGFIIPKDKIRHILDILYLSPAFMINDISKIGWEYFLTSTLKELHDRIIVSTCKQHHVEYLISKDKEIIESNEIKVVW
jgi:predicted nucleic acid-binding protein